MSLALCFSCFAPPALAYAGEHYLGKQGSNEFYYTTHKEHRRIIQDGQRLTSKSISKWTKGAVDLVMCLPKVGVKVSIPYTMVSSLVGNKKVTVKKKSYSKLICQIDADRRVFYGYVDRHKKNKRNVYFDEKGVMDVFYEWHPVGTGYSKSTYSKRVKKGLKLKTANYSNKKLILNRCSVNYKHRGLEGYSVDYDVIGRMSEQWKR